MAANDYFNPSHNPKPYYYGHDGHSESNVPLRPINTHTPSPYEETAYEHSSYNGTPYKPQDHYADPFTDREAIPMQTQRPYDDPHHITSPIDREAMPHEQGDPLVRDRDMDKQRRFDGPKEGWFQGRITWVCYTLSIIQIGVFIGEIIKNSMLTGSPIMIKPYFNFMIGPSPYVTINMGARYQPCMHSMDGVQNRAVPISWPCPNTTTSSGPGVSCSLSDLCGFGETNNPRVGGNLSDPAPNQWWRFIVPIFLHAGVIHILFNLLLQLTLGREIEKLIGSVRFFLVYFACGIWGFVLGGNFAPDGVSSVGCSGALFGILAIVLLDLLYTWSERRRPVVDLLFIILDLAIAFVLGLLPGLLDNFSHFGGFAMGLVLGVCLLHSPARFTQQDSIAQVVPYSGVSQANRTSARHAGLLGFFREPRTFFRNRRAIWWVWWLVRALALFLALIGFVLLLRNFYEWRTKCTWCKYLSCMDVTVGGTNWCDIGTLNGSITTTTTPAPTKNPARALLGRAFLA